MGFAIGGITLSTKRALQIGEPSCILLSLESSASSVAPAAMLLVQTHDVGNHVRNLLRSQFAVVSPRIHDVLRIGAVRRRTMLDKRVNLRRELGAVFGTERGIDRVEGWDGSIRRAGIVHATHTLFAMALFAVVHKHLLTRRDVTLQVLGDSGTRFGAV